MSPEVTRRRLFGGASAAAITLAVPGAARAAAAEQPSCSTLPPALNRASAGGRIDLHTHHIPPVYRAALLEAGMATIAGYPTPVWTPERHLAMMDQFGIQMAVLSLSDPGVGFVADQQAVTLARQVNEYTADLIRQYPTRFGGYVNLPLPNVQASLAELAYGLDVLKLDAVCVLSSYRGKSITDPEFDPLWAEINRRNAYVFMHPASLSADDKPSLPLPDFFVEFTFETTRFAALVLKTGLFERYPNLRVQLAHAGGAYPFLDYRVGLTQHGASYQLPHKGTDSQNGVLPAAAINGFFYDTAISPSPAQMRCILDSSDVSHIVFSSDWPFTELLFLIPGDPQAQLSLTFNTAQRSAVERANALRQLPGVAARLGAGPFDTAVDAKLVRTRMIKTKTGRRQIRILLDLEEEVQVEATLSRKSKTLASQVFAPLARGSRSLRFELGDDIAAGSARLALRVTDAFSNSRTFVRTIRIPGVS